MGGQWPSSVGRAGWWSLLEAVEKAETDTGWSWRYLISPCPGTSSRGTQDGGGHYLILITLLRSLFIYKIYFSSLPQKWKIFYLSDIKSSAEQSRIPNDKNIILLRKK